MTRSKAPCFVFNRIQSWLLSLDRFILCRVSFCLTFISSLGRTKGAFAWCLSRPSVRYNLFRVEGLLWFVSKLACRYLRQLSRTIFFYYSIRGGPRKRPFLRPLRQIYVVLKFLSDFNKILYDNLRRSWCTKLLLRFSIAPPKGFDAQGAPVTKWVSYPLVYFL